MHKYPEAEAMLETGRARIENVIERHFILLINICGFVWFLFLLEIQYVLTSSHGVDSFDLYFE